LGRFGEIVMGWKDEIIMDHNVSANQGLLKNLEYKDLADKLIIYYEYYNIIKDQNYIQFKLVNDDKTYKYLILKGTSEDNKKYIKKAIKILMEGN
jgi:hypothetical protein